MFLSKMNDTLSVCDQQSKIRISMYEDFIDIQVFLDFSQLNYRGIFDIKDYKFYSFFLDCLKQKTFQLNQQKINEYIILTLLLKNNSNICLKLKKIEYEHKK